MFNNNPVRLISQSTVSRTENKFSENWHVKDVPISRRSSKLNQDKQLDILLDIDEKMAVDKDVSKTVRLYFLRKAKYLFVKRAIGSRLNEDDPDRRFKFIKLCRIENMRIPV